ncbi:hypothetical protein [Nocardioides aquiterrae]|uniref:Uncharacterized protein n=1 Tax=Nocardioides aquiterrae TaxID=203799 RepID=A0ABN1U8L7_9ACTN
MNVKLTDDAVADLPLHEGRAELLDEILRTPGTAVPVLDGSRRPRWVAPVAAAAAVVLLAAGVAWTAGRVLGESAPPPATSQPATPDAFRVVLDQPGWAVTHVDQGDDLGGVGYENGGATLKLDWYLADGYAERIAHRRDEAGSDGTAVDVAGLPGSMWSAAAGDHTALRPVEDGHFLEVRGFGMDAAAFAALLPELRMVDQAAFDAALPPDYADDGNRRARVNRILDGIARYAVPLLPDGQARSAITSRQSDPVQLGSDVAEQVACAWIARYAEARRLDDRTGAQQAAGVLATSREWPVLRDIEADTDVPEWIWWASDEVLAGRVPQSWQPSCAG